MKAGTSPRSMITSSFDVVVGDALYFDAPLINFCLDRHKHVIVTAKGDHRLLVQDAQGLFEQQQPGSWIDKNGKRTVRFWDEEGFTSCVVHRLSLTAKLLATEPEGGIAR